MRELLYDYQLNLTTWVYLSSLLTIAIFFKFNRFWSLRNLDLIGLIALAPGLLLVEHGGTAGYVGYVWLFAVGAFFLARLLIDPMMVRRPLLEPNLSSGGLLFIAGSLLVFLMVNVLTKDPTQADLDGAKQLDLMIARKVPPPGENALALHGPGYPLLHGLASVFSRTLVAQNEQVRDDRGRWAFWAATARTMAIMSHLLIVAGMILIGLRHFDNVRTGVAAATLYLLLPYTAQMTGRVDHVLPAALLVWAVASYRRPLLSGVLLGLATGAIYYPLFLLPLWISFYWQRGLLRFSVGFVITLGLLVASLALTSSDMRSFLQQCQQMLGWTSLQLDGVKGFWSYFGSAAAFRIPVLAAFVAMSASFALWPAHKNLGTLLSCSAAIMLGTQFWHAQEGGLYAAWYLPLQLLTIFRPNLEDRMASTTLGEGWFKVRRAPAARDA